MISNENVQKECSEDTKISLFLRETIKLKNERQQLEKYQINLINVIKASTGVMFNDFFNDLNVDFRNKHNELILNLKKIINLKNFLKVNLTNLHKMKEIDSVQCKNIVENLNKEIIEMKNSVNSDLEKLLVSENILNEELDQITGQIKAWSSSKNKQSFISSNYGVNQQDEFDFYSFLYFNGGHEGGWTSEDHCFFLKTLKKYKNSDVVSELQNILPDISKDEILAHIDWFNKYNLLKKKHKQAIKEWKSTNVEKSSAEMKTSPEEIKVTKSKNKPVKNNVEIKNKILRWKEEKIIREEDKLKKLVITKSQNRLKETQKKLNQKHMKNIVEKWKTAKIIEEQSQKLLEQQKSLIEHQIKAIEANKHIKMYQKQDEEYIQRKLAKVTKSCDKPDLKNVSVVHVERDPARLMKATKQWIERTKHSDGIQYQMYYCINDIPKLKIPNWRVNL